MAIGGPIGSNREAAASLIGHDESGAGPAPRATFEVAEVTTAKILLAVWRACDAPYDRHIVGCR
jgi:hypothetical protein